MKNGNLLMIGKTDFLQFNFSNVGQLCGSQALLTVNYFKSINQEFSRHTHLHRSQKFTNYLLEIKFADPIFGKLPMNLFLGYGEILIIWSDLFSPSQNLYYLYLICSWWGKKNS